MFKMESSYGSGDRYSLPSSPSPPPADPFLFSWDPARRNAASPMMTSRTRRTTLSDHPTMMMMMTRTDRLSNTTVMMTTSSNRAEKPSSPWSFFRPAWRKGSTSAHVPSSSSSSRTRKDHQSSMKVDHFHNTESPQAGEDEVIDRMMMHYSYLENSVTPPESWLSSSFHPSRPPEEKSDRSRSGPNRTPTVVSRVAQLLRLERQRNHHRLARVRQGLGPRAPTGAEPARHSTPSSSSSSTSPSPPSYPEYLLSQVQTQLRMVQQQLQAKTRECQRLRRKVRYLSAALGSAAAAAALEENDLEADHDTYAPAAAVSRVHVALEEEEDDDDDDGHFDYHNNMDVSKLETGLDIQPRVLRSLLLLPPSASPDATVHPPIRTKPDPGSAAPFASMKSSPNTTLPVPPPPSLSPSLSAWLEQDHEDDCLLSHLLASEYRPAEDDSVHGQEITKTTASSPTGWSEKVPTASLDLLTMPTLAEVKRKLDFEEKVSTAALDLVAVPTLAEVEKKLDWEEDNNRKQVCVPKPQMSSLREAHVPGSPVSGSTALVLRSSQPVILVDHEKEQVERRQGDEKPSGPVERVSPPLDWATQLTEKATLAGLLREKGLLARGESFLPEGATLWLGTSTLRPPATPTQVDPPPRLLLPFDEAKDLLVPRSAPFILVGNGNAANVLTLSGNITSWPSSNIISAPTLFGRSASTSTKPMAGSYPNHQVTRFDLSSGVATPMLSLPQWDTRIGSSTTLLTKPWPARGQGSAPTPWRGYGLARSIHYGRHCTTPGNASGGMADSVLLGGFGTKGFNT